MNKTRKKLHRLVYPLSPLNPLTAEILMKIVWILVLRVRSARRRVLAPGTHTMFRHHSVCGGSIWKRFCACNIMDLAAKGLKSKYKFAAKSILCVYFFPFLHLKIQAEDKNKAFHIAQKLFKSTCTFWYKSLSFKCVPLGRLIVAKIIFVIFVIFKFRKILAY